MPETTAVEWRPVPDFPYEVSNDGRVRRTTPARSTRPGRVLKGSPDRYGYIVVGLSKEGHVHYLRVHRLVCAAFHGASDLPEIRHLDGDPSNNHASNLAWGTPRQNAADRIRHGRSQRGELHPSAKLTNAQAEQIRGGYAAMRAKHERTPAGWFARTAERYGITVGGLRNILSTNSYDRANSDHPLLATERAPVRTTWANVWLNGAGTASGECPSRPAR